MIRTASIGLSAAFALVLASAAQAQSPSVPNPSNPYPANPVATDGTPLPLNDNTSGGPLLSGRSAFAPVGAIVGFGTQTAGAAFDVGTRTAGAALNVGTQAAGTVLNVVPATTDAIVGH